MKRANDYMDNIKNAVGNKLVEPEGMYADKDGHLRLAREVGYALANFNSKETKHIKGSSYNNIYVIGCNLKPILDAKEWVMRLEEGHKKALDYRNYNGKRLYNQIKELAEVDAYYDRIKLDFEDLQLTKDETIEMYDEIIVGYNIKNIIDFKDLCLKLDKELSTV